MNIFKLAIAAALAFGTVSVASASAGAGTDQRGEYRDNDRRSDYRRDDDRRRHWRGNRGRHYGWRNNNRRWATRRVCRTVWRYGERRRICRIVRYRRYR
jgi:hypothetical protein